MKLSWLFLFNMNWEDYKNRFRSTAIIGEYTDSQIELCLKYAEKLNKNDLPIIYDQNHLSLLVGCDLTYLIGASNDAKRYYRTFLIPKKSGGMRSISEPLPILKEIQRWILDNILYKSPIHKCAKAYIPKISIKNNARLHLKQRNILSLDLKDFFGSITFSKIYKYFTKIGYNEKVSMMLANLCCLNGSLPQGAPTSAALSNIIASNIDNRIFGYCKKNNIRYTRYSDDLTFSGDFDAGNLIKFIKSVLLSVGFTLQEEKTRLRRRNQRQEVTGLVVNEKLQVPREVRRNLRKDIYYIKKYGLSSHMTKKNISKANYVMHLRGIANFVKFINPKDGKIKEYIEYLKEFTDK